VVREICQSRVILDIFHIPQDDDCAGSQTRNLARVTNGKLPNLGKVGPTYGVAKYLKTDARIFQEEPALVDSIRPRDWIYEIKFDGYRAVALRGGDETRILSRNEKELGRKFPEVKDAVAALAVQDAVVDGEIVALDDKGRSSFQLLQRFDMGLVRPPIVFYAFDLLRLNGKDLQGLPIEERKAKLEALLKKGARCNSVFGFIHEKRRRAFIPGPRIGT
jgi:ATP-dependent DNA ligase